MNFFKKLLVLILPLTLAFTACDETEPEPDPTSATSTLIANAGTDQDVKVSETVTLDGSASKDSENKPMTYAWNLIKKPANSQVTLNGLTTAKPTFVPDLVGEYEAELTVSNGAGTQKDKVLVKVAFAPVVLNDIEAKTILEDRNADPNAFDYLVNKDIAVQAELTVKPGVVIAFAANTRMDINDNGGAVIAKGEADRKVRFTGQSATKGFWEGILIWSTSSANEFTNAEILFAGGGVAGEVNKTSVVVYDHARITVKNTLVSESGGYGIYLKDGSELVAFSNNTFSNNTKAPLLLTAYNVPKLDNASLFTSNNGRNVIEVERSVIETEGEVVWSAFNDNTPYRFVGLVTVSNNTGWKLSAGITIELMDDQFGNNNYIEVGSGGYINAVGTPEKKITFTGVDKTTSSWDGIIIYAKHESNIMKHVQINYAGEEDIVSGVKSGITLSHGGSLNITNSSISNSGGYGIYVNGNDCTLNNDAATSNTFTSNVKAPIFKP